MTKYIICAVITAALCLPLSAQAQEAQQAPVDVAAAAPGNAKTPVTSKNLPLYLDEDLASKHADFSSFAKTKVSSLNRNHRLSKSRMQIIPQPDGTYRARYHSIDDQSLVCKVRRSKSKTIPYVAILSYKEKVYEAVGASPDACRKAEFIPVAIIPNRHIFSFKKGRWQ
ncbi:hypothetical protein [Pseudodesulfovibrio sp. zrk46]|uniref:hypothetical protein n=1 Tax=Pseudodesulfovibrio sp. zrk46 TaxID=2725288 RepID=UPI001448CA40|nr:hypothetical protein [Pseudodesulfovibrio sp. zrk46]QJB55526.1 hypothetical protein HFN16_03555 [Pseudodesulfovibrio sp. zrk46]